MTLSRTACFVITGSAVLSLASCVATREDVASLEVQVARLDKSIVTIGKDMISLEKKQADLGAKIDEVKKPVDSLNSNLNDTQNLLSNFSARFEEIRSSMESLRKDYTRQIADIAKKIETMSQNVQTRLEEIKKLSGNAKAKAAPAKSQRQAETEEIEPEDAPLKTFQEAYKDFLAKRWDLAQTGFEHYLKNHPEGSLADKSLYYIALSKKQTAGPSAAHEALEQLLSKFPKSPVARAGMIEKARLFQEEGKPQQAEGMLEYIIITYAGAKEASEAREMLKTLPHLKEKNE
ncbi:MAG: hypothetical protein AAB091_07400 [Elusimicrobiota bacterium]